jgi:hypothetical protein
MKIDIRRYFDPRSYARDNYRTNYNFRVLNGGLGYQPGDAARGGTRRYSMHGPQRPAPLGPNAQRAAE